MTTLGLGRRKTDRHLVLEQLNGGMMTTLELASAIKLDPARVGRTVSICLDEHCCSHGVQRTNGWAWVIEDVGRTELARMEASFTGAAFVDPMADTDVEANMRRNLGGER